MFAQRNLSLVHRPIQGAVFNLGASQTLKIDLPVGLTYRELEIEAKIGGAAGTPVTRAQFISMWTNIRILVDGEERVNMPMSDYLDQIEYYRGGIMGAGSPGYLPICWEWMWNDDIVSLDKNPNPLAAKVAPGWGMKNHGSFVVELVQDVTSTINYVNVWPDLDPIPEDLGLHGRFVRLTATAASTGNFDFAVPFRELNQGRWVGDQGGSLYGIHIKPPTLANLTYLRMTCDGLPFREGTVEQWHRSLLRATDKRTIQTGWLHCELNWRNFDRDALQWDALDAPLLLNFTFANAAPNTFPIYLHVASPDTRKPSV